MKKKSNPQKFFVLAIVLIIVGLGFALFELHLLTVKTIIVQNYSGECITDENIKKETALFGKQIFLINQPEISKKIISRHPCLKNVNLKVKFPQTVEIQVFPRTPFLSVTSYSGKEILQLKNLEATPSSSAALIDWSRPTLTSGQTFIADETGIIFSQQQLPNLPLVFWPNQNLQFGQQLNKEIFEKIGQIITQFSQLGLSTQAKLSGDFLLFESSPKVAFSLKKDVSRQLASLQLILQKAKIDEKAMEIIDLRFDKPIIIYASKK